MFENEEWTLISGQTSEGMLGCTDSTELTYDVGSELFINDCEYIICEQDDNWSDTMTVDDCFNIGCIAGACVDVSLFGQEGSYSSEEQCIEDCQAVAGEPSFECIAGMCIDIGQFGQEGSYDSLG